MSSRFPIAGDLLQIEHGFSVYSGKCLSSDGSLALIEIDLGEHRCRPIPCKFFLSRGDGHHRYIIIGHESKPVVESMNKLPPNKQDDNSQLCSSNVEPETESAERPRRNWFMRLIFGDRR
jgi:hypothetical protein